MKVLWRVLDFLLYSHIFIASCVIASIYLTSRYFCCFDIPVEYYLFVSGGTLLIYNLHRLLSLYKIQQSAVEVDSRFRKIQSYEWWYIISSGIAIIGCGYAFTTFETDLKILIAIPSIISALYILPVFPSKKRLRDYNFLKIFLIAFCWAWLSCIIPLEYSDASQGLQIALGLEKFLFIFAITLPFDFRDLELDEQQSVQTIVSEIGYERAIGIAACALIISLIIIAALVFIFGLVNTIIFYGFLLSYLIIFVILTQAFRSHSDYYYTFAVDGSMWLLVIIVVILKTIG